MPGSQDGLTSSEPARRRVCAEGSARILRGRLPGEAIQTALARAGSGTLLTTARSYAGLYAWRFQHLMTLLIIYVHINSTGVYDGVQV